MLTVFGIDAALHPVGVVRGALTFFNDERHLSAMAFAGVSRIGVAHAAVF
jgi:hypothetical protein